MASKVEKDLGQKGVAWRAANPAPQEGRLVDGPRDEISYDDGYGWLTTLAVHQMPLDVLEGIQTGKAWWLSVGCDEARTRVLVERINGATKALLLWDAAHDSADALVGKGAKTMNYALLDRRFLHTVERLGATVELELVGASVEHVAKALEVPKLRTLRLREPSATAVELLDALPAKITVYAPDFSWERGYLRVSPDALSAEPPADNSLKVLAVRGPGVVDAARLARWAQSVSELHLEQLEGLDVASVAHKKLKKLRLFRCGIEDAGIIDVLLKGAPKLEVVDLTGNGLPVITHPKVRVVQVKQSGAAPAPMPSDDRFERLVRASAATRRVLLLAWGLRLANNLRSCLDFVPAAAGQARKLAKAGKEDLWINRLWAVQDADFPGTNSFLEANDTWRAFSSPNSAIRHGCRTLVNGDWQQTAQTADGLRRIATLVAQSEFLARRWHPLLPVPALPEGHTARDALDAITVIHDLDDLEANEEAPLPEVLPFAERQLGVASVLGVASRWGLRALTRLALELPEAEARVVRDLRERACLGDMEGFMEATPTALVGFGLPRASSLASAIVSLGDGVQGGDPTALGAFAVRLRRWHGLPFEASAQERDLRMQHHRIAWLDLDEVVLAGRLRMLSAYMKAPIPAAVEQALGRGKLVAPGPVGDIDDAWSHQWVTWLDLLAHAKKQRAEVAIITGRHMAEWVGRDALFASVPTGARYEHFGLDQDRYEGIDLFDVLPKHLDWGIADPMLDDWARAIVETLQRETEDLTLQRVLDTWVLGQGNRMATRWPSMEPLVDPVVDPWLRALDAVDALFERGPDARLDKARWGLAQLCSGALAPDDSKSWYEEVAGAVVALVPGRTAEELRAQVEQAFVE